MASPPPSTAKLKKLVDDYSKQLEQVDFISQISAEVASSGDSPSPAALEIVRSMWGWKALPAVFIHVIYTSYCIFEYPESMQAETKVELLKSVIYLSAQFADVPQNAQEMVNLRYPLYFFSILKSQFAPESVKSAVMSLFLALAKSAPEIAQFLAKNELTSILMLELQYVKSTSTYTQLCINVLAQLIEKHPSFYSAAARKQAVLESLRKYIQGADKSGKAKIEKNVQTAQGIIAKVEKLE